MYGAITTAKTGEAVPLFTDGRPAHSKYSPETEAAAFGSGIDGGFIIVGGIGGGFHLRALRARLQGRAFIMACESDAESLAFCRNLPLVQELPDILLCTVQEAAGAMLRHYLPALHGDLTFLSLRTWETHNEAACAYLRQAVNSTLQAISADYSVQAHFGRLWQRNILINLQEAGANCMPALDTGRPAAIIAAGPSLDAAVHRLPNGATVIATDTAYGSLLAHGITPEAVVSIDAQQVSHTHFLPCPPAGKMPTTFIFDVAANPEAIRLVRKRGHRAVLVRSAHPLAACLCPELPMVESGAGTVTIAACDAARLLGFSRMELLGADFCYSGGKPYARGTYLDTRIHGAAYRAAPSETSFTALMFRTPVLPAPAESLFSGRLPRPTTSPVLQRYGATLMDWAERHGYRAEGRSLIARAPTPAASFTTPCPAIKLRALLRYAAAIPEHGSDASPRLHAEDYALLPYIAWLRKNEASGNKPSFFALLKLAYSHVRRYTRLYEN